MLLVEASGCLVHDRDADSCLYSHSSLLYRRDLSHILHQNPADSRLLPLIQLCENSLTGFFSNNIRQAQTQLRIRPPYDVLIFFYLFRPEKLLPQVDSGDPSGYGP